jgi:hypothetical protein
MSYPQKLADAFLIGIAFVMTMMHAYENMKETLKSLLLVIIFLSDSLMSL